MFNFLKCDYPHQWNEKQDKIMAERQEAYDKIAGVRVGDYIRRKDGTISRATYDWGESIQDGGSCGGQFYFGEKYLSYSGGLNPGVEKARLRQTEEVKKGMVWFFIDDYHTVANGIYYEMDFRVFEEI